MLTILVRFLEAIIKLGEFWKDNRKFVVVVSLASAVGTIVLLGSIGYTQRAIASHVEEDSTWRNNIDDFRRENNRRLDRLERNADSKAEADHENFTLIYRVITDNPKAKLKKPKIEKE